jgi:hypothetical protein
MSALLHHARKNHQRIICAQRFTANLRFAERNQNRGARPGVSQQKASWRGRHVRSSVDSRWTRSCLVGGEVRAATGKSRRTRQVRKTGWPMMQSTVVQYVGFQAKAHFREYRFNVRDGNEQREFTLSIENEAFSSRRVQVQDGPNICSLRLRTELACANPPVAPLHYHITGAELDDFREAHSPKATRNLYTPKRDDDF